MTGASSLTKILTCDFPANLLGRRHLQIFMIFLAAFISYGVRTNMSVGILAMMDKNNTNSDVPTFPEWTEKNTILSAFFWGYVIPQIGAGALVKRFGPKWFLAVTIFIGSIFTILIPIMAINAGEGGVIACRVIQGLNQGFLYPSLHNLLGKWAPLSERSKAASFVYSGGALGTVIALPLTGMIAASSVGWPTAFYVYGGLEIAWCVLWVFFGADSPAKHGGLSKEEREYIDGGAADDDKPEIPTPWKSIVTSLPFFALLVAHSGQCWGYWTLLNEIPSYMEKVMKFKIADNSLLSALPYFVLWLLSFVFSPIADFLIVRKYLSIGAVRKIFNSIGLMGPSVALIAVSFVDSSEKDLEITLLVLSVGLNAGVYSGFHVNHIDLSPNHAGVLMGITNSLSNIFGIVAPLVVKVFPYEEIDPVFWRYVFCIAAGVYVGTALFFDFFASREVQSWNDESKDKEDGDL